MSKLIFVIDDSATICKIVHVSLERAGFEVLTFRDGVEALRYLASPQARIPDLVLLDVRLPKMDGYEVARRLKAKPLLDKTVLVMLSRYSGMLERLKGRLVGVQDYIAKPFTTERLLSVVTSHLGMPMTFSL